MPAILGKYGLVSNQNCGTAIAYRATPLATTGQGCYVSVICNGAPTGTPTPSWKID